MNLIRLGVITERPRYCDPLPVFRMLEVPMTSTSTAIHKTGFLQVGNQVSDLGRHHNSRHGGDAAARGRRRSSSSNMTHTARDDTLRNRLLHSLDPLGPIDPVSRSRAPLDQANARSGTAEEWLIASSKPDTWPSPAPHPRGPLPPAPLHAPSPPEVPR